MEKKTLQPLNKETDDEAIMHDNLKKKKKIITIMHDEFIFGENNALRITIEEIEDDK